MKQKLVFLPGKSEVLMFYQTMHENWGYVQYGKGEKYVSYATLVSAIS